MIEMIFIAVALLWGFGALVFFCILMSDKEGVEDLGLSFWEALVIATAAAIIWPVWAFS